jgi:hypothetical protein
MLNLFRLWGPPKWYGFGLKFDNAIILIFGKDGQFRLESQGKIVTGTYVIKFSTMPGEEYKIFNCSGG